MKRIVLRFTASWCSKCNMLEKSGQLSKLQADYPNITWQDISIETELGEKLAEKLAIKSLPCFFVFEVDEKDFGSEVAENILTLSSEQILRLAERSNFVGTIPEVKSVLNGEK